MAVKGKQGSDDTMWLPGEVCVVCTVDRDVGRASSFYDAVLGWLNAEVIRLLGSQPSQRTPSRGQSIDPRDLEWSGLSHRFRSARPLLVSPPNPTLRERDDPRHFVALE